jgi:shikimate kinase
MGVGKSTTARLLVHRLGWPLRDSDIDIDRLFGVTGAVIAAQHGVHELHRVEAAVLLGALASDTPAVITAASSVIEDPRCREAMSRRADVVALEAPDDLLDARRTAGDHRRAVDAGAFRALVARRRPLYAAAADLRLDATRSPSALADAIIHAFVPGSSGPAVPGAC